MKMLAAVITLWPWLILTVLLLAGCTTTYVTYSGECNVQRWEFAGYTFRHREVCMLPEPVEGEEDTEDKEMAKPFPGVFDLNNSADSPDKDLLEKQTGRKPATGGIFEPEELTEGE